MDKKNTLTITYVKNGVTKTSVLNEDTINMFAKRYAEGFEMLHEANGETTFIQYIQAVLMFFD